jgi:hypothetical protein
MQQCRDQTTTAAAAFCYLPTEASALVANADTLGSIELNDLSKFNWIDLYACVGTQVCLWMI